MTINPIPAAMNAPVSAEAPRVGDTFSSCERRSGAGSAPLLRLSVSSFAHFTSKVPSICAEPPQILSWIVGEVIS